jgi:hypothetical protein
MSINSQLMGLDTKSSEKKTMDRPRKRCFWLNNHRPKRPIPANHQAGKILSIRVWSNNWQMVRQWY